MIAALFAAVADGFADVVALDLIAFPRGVAPGLVPPDKIFLLGLAVGPGQELTARRVAAAAS